MTETRHARWTDESIAAVGSALANPDPAVRSDVLDNAVSDGILDLVDNDLARQIVGRRTLDSDAAIRALPDLAAFREAAIEELNAVTALSPSSVPGGWGLKALFDEARHGRTHRLKNRLVEVLALESAQAIVRHELGEQPASGAGAGGLIGRKRWLNKGAAHGDWLFDALTQTGATGGSDALGRKLWGTYLRDADLFGQAERLGAEATACASGTPLVMILNARAAMVLDRAETFADEQALDHARGLVHQAWTTEMGEPTRNVQHRLARLSRHAADRRIAGFMDRMLKEWDLDG